MLGKSIHTNLIGSEEERAVSPVIGVILMVAITVILASVIAAFVLDLGGGINSNAQASVTVTGDGTTNVTIDVRSLQDADGVVVVDDSGTVVDSNSNFDGQVGGGASEIAIADDVGATITLDSGSGDAGEYRVLAHFGGPADDERTGEVVIGDFELEASNS